jgi:K+-transporting ATPase ATPase A chain
LPWHWRGFFVEQPRRPASPGTLATDTLTFALLLLGSILIVTGLSYLPALALGPIAEHFMQPG